MSCMTSNLLLCIPIFLFAFVYQGKAYDPLDTFESIETLDWAIKDKSRNRSIPLKFYFPEGKTNSPVILFSHGLGGSRNGCSYLGKHWAGRGYVAVFMQHIGSDESVWKDVGPLRRMFTLKKAASYKNFMLRVHDVSAVLDRLEKLNLKSDSTLSGKLNLSRVGMSGHSFGALTTQAVSGEKIHLSVNLTERRIKAAMPLSPGSRKMISPDEAFGEVSIPWLLMTGTHDLASIGGQTIDSRLAVFPALPQGNHYELVLNKAEHSAFNDKAFSKDKLPRNPNHLRVILGLSTAFWDAYLRNDAEARSWLNGDSPRKIMEKQDRWQKK